MNADDPVIISAECGVGGCAWHDWGVTPMIENNAIAHAATHVHGWYRLTIVIPQPCFQCGATEGVSFDSDPFASEIRGDDTPVWGCVDCRRESLMEI